MRTGDVLATAKKRRRDQIKVLRACRCDWPVNVRRNISGHAPSCPAHRLYLDAVWNMHPLEREVHRG